MLNSTKTKCCRYQRLLRALALLYTVDDDITQSSISIRPCMISHKWDNCVTLYTLRRIGDAIHDKIHKLHSSTDVNDSGSFIFIRNLIGNEMKSAMI